MEVTQVDAWVCKGIIFSGNTQQMQQLKPNAMRMALHHYSSEKVHVCRLRIILL